MMEKTILITGGAGLVLWSGRGVLLLTTERTAVTGSVRVRSGDLAPFNGETGESFD